MNPSTEVTTGQSTTGRAAPVKRATNTRSSWARAIVAGLESRGGNVRRIGNDRWRASSETGDAIVAEHRHGWLAIETDAPKSWRAHRVGWQLLALAGGLPPGVKCTRAPGRRTTILRIEEEVRSSCRATTAERKARVQAALKRLRGASRALATQSPGTLAAGGAPVAVTRPLTDEGTALPGAGQTRPPADLRSVAGLCEDAGWPCLESDRVPLRVDLEGGASGFRQAEIEVLTEGWIRLSTDLSAGHVLPSGAAHRGTVAGFLLEATAAVRLVRANLRVKKHPAMTFEVVLAGGEPYSLHQALAALSSACQLFARETETLIAAPDLALAYAARRQPRAERTARSERSRWKSGCGY